MIKTSADQKEVVAALFLAREPQHEHEADERGDKKGAVAQCIERLGEERLVGPTLAIEEDAISESHGPVLSTRTRGKSLSRRQEVLRRSSMSLSFASSLGLAQV